MSNIHVLDYVSGTYRLVFHVNVPVGTNSAGVAWNTALVNSGRGGTSALKSGDGTAGTITAAENASILAGNVLEVVYQFSPTADFEGATGAQQLAFVDGLYAKITGDKLTELAQVLKRWGLTLA